MKFQRHQIILAGLLGVTLVGMLVGWYIVMPTPVNKCPPSLVYTVDTISYCGRSPIVDSVGFPLHYTNTWPIAFVFFLLMFVRKEIFSWWWKFALPAGVCLIYGVISTSPNAGFSIFGGRSEQTHLLSSLFALYSVIVIFATYLGYWLYGIWKKKTVGN